MNGFHCFQQGRIKQFHLVDKQQERNVLQSTCLFFKMLNEICTSLSTDQCSLVYQSPSTCTWNVPSLGLIHKREEDHCFKSALQNTAISSILNSTVVSVSLFIQTVQLCCMLIHHCVLLNYPF